MHSTANFLTTQDKAAHFFFNFFILLFSPFRGGLNPNILGFSPFALGLNPSPVGLNPNVLGLIPKAVGTIPNGSGLNPNALGLIPNAKFQLLTITRYVLSLAKSLYSIVFRVETNYSSCSFSQYFQNQISKLTF